MNGINATSRDADTDGETPIEAAWVRIENWLMENAPMTLLTLNAGATEKEIWAAEAALGRQFPPDVVESARLHNGQTEGTLTDEAQLLPLLEMATEYHRRIALTDFSAECLPLTTNENTYLNAKGMVTHFETRPNPPFVFDDFAEWLTCFADALEGNEYFWDEEADALMLVRRHEMD